MQRLMKDRIAILGNLVTGVAHEINNPLTIILGNLDVAKKEILQETEKKIDTNKILESLKDAQHAAERIFNIVNSLTIFSTIKEFNCGKYNINEILNNKTMTRIDNISPYAEEIIIQTEKSTQTQLGFKDILKERVKVPQEFVKLETEGKNYMCSTQG